MCDEDYLLEVIVSDVQLVTKLYKEKIETKKPRFGAKANPEVQTSENDLPKLKFGRVGFTPRKDDSSHELLDVPIDAGVGEVVIRVKAFSLPDIDIHEDHSKHSDKEKRWWKELQKSKGLDENKTTSKFPTVPDWKDEVLTEDTIVNKKFKKGKSYFFQMNPQTLMNNVRGKDIIVNMFREGIDGVCVGRVKIPVPDTFIAAICAANRSSMFRKVIDACGPIFPDLRAFKKEMNDKRARRRCLNPINDNPYSPDKLMEMEPYVRFKNVYKVPVYPEPCPYCDDCGCGSGAIDGCNFIKKKPEKKIIRPKNYLDPEELMDPSPDPIEPERLPTTAEIDTNISFVNEKNKVKAHADIFVRLTCFGNVLRFHTEEQCENEFEIPYDDYIPPAPFNDDDDDDNPTRTIF